MAAFVFLFFGTLSVDEGVVEVLGLSRVREGRVMKNLWVPVATFTLAVALSYLTTSSHWKAAARQAGGLTCTPSCEIVKPRVFEISSPIIGGRPFNIERGGMVVGSRQLNKAPSPGGYEMFIKLNAPAGSFVSDTVSHPLGGITCALVKTVTFEQFVTATISDNLPAAAPPIQAGSFFSHVLITQVNRGVDWDVWAGFLVNVAAPPLVINKLSTRHLVFGPTFLGSATVEARCTLLRRGGGPGVVTAEQTAGIVVCGLE